MENKKQKSYYYDDGIKNMNLEEFRQNRKERLEKLQEALTNMPKINGDTVHGEIDAVTFDAIKSSDERDEKVKEAFKEKNKEVREFIKDQDKDTEADKEEKSEDRLELNESLFEGFYDADDVRSRVKEYVLDCLNNAVEAHDIMIRIPGYNADWCDEEADLDIFETLGNAADLITDSLFKNYEN